jgi:cytochrome c
VTAAVLRWGPMIRAPRSLTFFVSLLLAASLPPAARAAESGAQLATDKGCVNCHSNLAPKKKAPTFKRLAADYAALRDRPEALRERAEKLRSGSIFGHIDAHERLSTDEAAQLVRWLADGAP